MFGSVVSEEFYHTYSLTTTIVSCLSNIMLIYVLAVTHLAHVGPYRYLLLIFAVVDVLISLVHLALIPAIHMTEFGYIYFGYRFIHDDTSTGVGAGLIWVLLFYQTFVLLAFHYVYRYVMLCSPAWLSGFRQNPWRSWLAATFVADIIFVGGILLCCFMGLLPNDQSRTAFAPVLQEVYSIDLFAPNKPGYLGIIYWTLNDKGEKEWIPWKVFTICCVIVLFFTTALIIIVCILRIVLELSDSRVGNLAPATKRLQKQLFNTLLWQTIIPTITSYTPLAMIFLVPLTGNERLVNYKYFINDTVNFDYLEPASTMTTIIVAVPTFAFSTYVYLVLLRKSMFHTAYFRIFIAQGFISMLSFLLILIRFRLALFEQFEPIYRYISDGPAATLFDIFTVSRTTSNCTVSLDQWLHFSRLIPD